MEHPLSAFCLRAQRVVIGVAIAGSTLVVWPSQLEPFGLPKATLAVMAAVIVAALWAIRVAVTRRSDLPIGAVSLAMTAVIIGMAIATLASATPLVAAIGPIRYTGLVPYLAYFLIALAAMTAFRRVPPKAVLLAILIAGSIEVVYGFLQSVGWQPLPFGSYATPVFGTLGNANFLSGWLAITMPVALWAALAPAHSRNWRIAAALLTAGCGLVLWQSNSFQGLPAAAAGIAVVGLAWLTTPAATSTGPVAKLRSMPRPALAGVFGIAAVVLAALAVVLLPAIADRIGSGGAARLEFWSAARRLVMDHPVLGTGPGTFVQYYAAYYQPTGTVAYELADDPHSVPLAMFTGGGAVVGLAYLVLVAVTGFVLILGLRRSRGADRLLLAALGGAWIAYQVQSAVSIDIPPLALAHWVLAACIAGLAGSIRFGFRSIEAAEPPRQRPRSHRRSVPLPVGTKVVMAVALTFAALLFVVTTRPMRAVAATERVNELINTGEPQRALVEARRATEMAPWDDRTWAEYARVAKGLQEFADARTATQRALDLAPGNSAYALQLAALAQRDQDFDEVVRLSRYAARVDPRSPTALAGSARLLLSYGRGDEAERLVMRGLDIQPTAELWAVLGLRRALEGREAAAIEAYRKALALDPSHPEAKAFLEARGVTG